MAAERNEHLVVIMLEPVPAGEEFEIWPPHITIVPWFPGGDARRLDETLATVAGRHQPFTVKAGKVEEWGKREKYEVQKIDADWRLLSLHWDVFRSLEKNGFPIHQKEHLGEKYVPHIALRNRLQRGSEIDRGKELAIVNLSLFKQIRLKKSGRMIKSLVKDYELG